MKLFNIVPNRLITQAINYVKCDVLRPGRCDSACHHIAKIMQKLYFEELEAPKGRKRTRVVN